MLRKIDNTMLGKIFKKGRGHTLPTIAKTMGWVLYAFLVYSAWMLWVHPGRIIDGTIPKLTGDSKDWASTLCYLAASRELAFAAVFFAAFKEDCIYFMSTAWANICVLKLLESFGVYWN